jgi:curved DNA-binding protein CbpA
LAAGKTAGGVLDFKGYYAMLGLSGEKRLSASQSQIKAAYLRAAKELHPDKHARRNSKEQLASAERFRRLQAAYGVLADPRKRKEYDAGASPSPDS